MRNLKKILALVLALVMSFSVMTISSAAFPDQDKINDAYAESIDVLTALKVFEGDEYGKFNPQGSITRAEVAAIIYRVATGDVTSKAAMYTDLDTFTDVKSNDWYAGYINYCANAGYVRGMGDGTFDPQGKVTGFQALAMILRAIGYDKNDEFAGAAYTVEVGKVATQLNLTRNLQNVTLGVAATREVVAEILFQTIIVPQVSYTLALGYSQYSDVLQQKKNPTLAEQNFGLVRISGVIDSVYRGAGVTVIKDTETYNNTVVEKVYQVQNAENSWENIGYAAHIYGVETAKPGVYNALTKTYMDGQSLAVTTNGTPFAVYRRAGIVDATYRVYLNGVLMGNSNDYFQYVDADNDKVVDQTDRDYVLQVLTSQTGVKVDYVDNDGAGKADAIVVTHYTVAEVTGVAHSYNSGNNAVKKDHYYLTGIDGLSQVNDYVYDEDGVPKKANGKYLLDSDVYVNKTETNKKNDSAVAAYHVDNIIFDDALLKGELVTYVDYMGEAYITRTTTATGDLTKIDRLKVDDSDTNYTVNDVYTVGENEYMVADDYAFETDVLVRNYLGATVVLALDPYGYVLNSEEYAEPDSYLYVYENDQTKGLGSNRLTETRVVFADGTSADVMVKGTYTEKGALIDNFFDSTYDYDKLGEAVYDDDSMPRKVYTYRVVDGVYYLYETSDFTYVSAASYTAGKALFAQYDVYDAAKDKTYTYNVGLNNKSTVVDVRSSRTLGNVYVGHSGDAQVPSLKDFGAWVMLNDNDLVEFGFLVNGTNKSATYYKDFIAYHTGVHDVTYDAYYGRIYHIEVIDLSTGTAAKTEIQLSQAEYENLVMYGVGRYTYINSSLTYTAFNEEWLSVNWGWDTLSFVDKNTGETIFVEYDEVPFYVLNIGDEDATLYTMEDGFDGKDLFGDCKAYVNFTYDRYNDPVVLEIYVIDGVLASKEDDPNASAKKVYHDKVWGYDSNEDPIIHTYTYEVLDGFITTFIDSNDITDLLKAIEEYEEALAKYREAVKALEEYMNAMTAAASEEEEDPTLASLYEAVKQAWNELFKKYNAMMTELKKAQKEGDVSEVVEDTVTDHQTEYTDEITKDHNELLSDVKDVADDFETDIEDELDELFEDVLDVTYSVNDDVYTVVIDTITEEIMELDAVVAYVAEGATVDVDYAETPDLTDSNTVEIKVTITLAGEKTVIKKTLTVNATKK